MPTYLFDTKTNTVITDAVEILNGIWVHANDNRHICTDTQIGDESSGRRFRIINEDSAKRIIAEREKLRDQKRRNEEEKNNRLEREMLNGIWVHANDNRHICTDAQIGDELSGRRFRIINEDSAKRIIAEREQLRDQKRRNEEEKNNRLERELLNGIWVHANDNRHICTDAQIGDESSGRRFRIINEDSAKRIIAEREKLRDQKRRNEEEKNNRLEREMLVEQERRKKKEDQSCKDKEETSQEGDDCIIMNDSFNCCSYSGELSSNQKCIIPLRCSNDIPDVQNYENYEAAKKCIIQYELPEWLCEQLRSLSEDYANMQNTNVHLSCEEGEQFWRVFYQVRYFPRTLCETFFVFNEEFSCSKPQLPDKINILSIGCGSGGDVIGLLLAIDSYLTKKVKVSIVVFEVNDNAYKCFENNLNSVTQLFQHVEVEKQNRRNSAISFDNNDFEGLKDKFYFILCSKMVNEIMRKKIKDAVNEWDGKNIEDLKLNINTIEQEFQGLYKKLLEKLSPRMSEKGYCLLSELTDKPVPKELSSPESFDSYLANNPNLADYETLSKLNNRNDLLSDLNLNKKVKFLPQYFNPGVKLFIAECEAFRPVSPWGCDGCWSQMDCFTQLQFYVHNPVLRTANDKFEGVCFKLIKKDRRVKRVNLVNGNRKNNLDKNQDNNLAVNIKRERRESRFSVLPCPGRNKKEELTGDNIQSAFEQQRN